MPGPPPSDSPRFPERATASLAVDFQPIGGPTRDLDNNANADFAIANYADRHVKAFVVDRGGYLDRFSSLSTMAVAVDEGTEIPVLLGKGRGSVGAPAAYTVVVCWERRARSSAAHQSPAADLS